MGQAQCLPIGQSLCGAKSGVRHLGLPMSVTNLPVVRKILCQMSLSKRLLWVFGMMTRSIPKPNIKVIFIQMTLILLTDHLWHPYGILRPLPDPVADVIWHVDIHREVEGLHISDGAMVAAEHPTLLRGAIGHWGIGGNGCCLYEPRVCGLTLIVPLQGMECINHCYLAQRVK